MSQIADTSHSLLRRALDLNDQEAWDDLDQHYRRFIYYILHQAKAPLEDIEDLTQQVMILLMRNLKNYDSSKGSFRSWLRSVITNATFSHFRKMKSQQERIKAFSHEVAQSETFKRSGVEKFIEEEWEKYLSTLALERVKKTFNERTMYAFELGLKGMEASLIAEEVGLKVSTVYTLRKRVKQALYAEVKSLASQLEG